MWLLMKRGCKIAPVYCTKLNIKPKLDLDLEVEQLRKWDPFLKLRYLTDDDIEVSDDFELQGHTNSEYIAAETLARKIKAEAIVTGETYEQLNNKLFTRDNRPSLPIFYPLVGLDGAALNDLASKIFE